MHIADVHLGLAGKGLYGAEEHAFERAIDLAIDVAADGVLIVGDLFDHGRVSDDLLVWTAKEFDRIGRPVVLLVGNHDPLDDRSVHHRSNIRERCAQVLFLDQPDGMSVEIPELDLVVWGRAMVEHSRSFRPLAGVPSKPADRWAVVAAHGLVVDADRPSHHASPISDEELRAVEWDYVALGHHHGHQVVRHEPCPVVYPGATARSFKGEPGVVLVDFVPGAPAEPRWVALPTS
jgi:DNA repair exonuclease SbcCD nuclease subunit